MDNQEDQKVESLDGWLELDNTAPIGNQEDQEVDSLQGWLPESTTAGAAGASPAELTSEVSSTYKEHQQQLHKAVDDGQSSPPAHDESRGKKRKTLGSAETAAAATSPPEKLKKCRSPAVVQKARKFDLNELATSDDDEAGFDVEDQETIDRKEKLLPLFK